MARRDQPYLPLYVQDFLTDEKLIECSAESTGVYIRLMCIMHKSQDYGAILLKQKDKQSDKQIKNFALKLARQMPYDLLVIERALTELSDEGVITIDGDTLYQKRMVKDGNLSDKRSISGKKGGKQTANRKNTKDDSPEFATDFAKAKDEANSQANPENENEIENEDKNEDKEKGKRGTGEKGKTRKKREQPQKVDYAEYVHMTEAEHQKLLDKYGPEKTARMIEVLDLYKGSNGKAYKDDYRAILNWVVERVEEEYRRNGGGSGGGEYRNPDSGSGFKPSGGFKSW